MQCALLRAGCSLFASGGGGTVEQPRVISECAVKSTHGARIMATCSRLGPQRGQPPRRALLHLEPELPGARQLAIWACVPSTTKWLAEWTVAVARMRVHLTQSSMPTGQAARFARERASTQPNKETQVSQEASLKRKRVRGSLKRSSGATNMPPPTK